MILRAQTNFVKFLEQVLGVLKEVEIDKTECSILTRMLVFVSKSHRKGLGKHGKNFKTKFR
ncbi:hypothetical protein [Helicobacter pylori]|uniref:hypothetical protein n=1 Tax=Helicobacter pylori TaxID=210 RepID=UPI001AA42A5C|nr:hypothetical protein VN1261_07880 [Helicobacter pylori]